MNADATQSGTAHDEANPEEEQENIRCETENSARYSPQRYWDAADLARAVRKEELDFMHDWEVWDVVPISESWAMTGKAPLQGKWVDVNKGGLERPVVRSRYVAKEFANVRSDDFFAANPPLVALRMILSHVASGRSSKVAAKFRF